MHRKIVEYWTKTQKLVHHGLKCDVSLRFFSWSPNLSYSNRLATIHCFHSSFAVLSLKVRIVHESVLNAFIAHLLYVELAKKKWLGFTIHKISQSVWKIARTALVHYASVTTYMSFAIVFFSSCPWCTITYDILNKTTQTHVKSYKRL